MTNEQALIAEIHNLPQNKRDEAVDAALRLIKSLAKQAVEKPEMKKLPRRKAGSRPGAYIIGSDFDDPIEGFEEYM
jgi:hypothetical protein